MLCFISYISYVTCAQTVSESTAAVADTEEHYISHESLHDPGDELIRSTLPEYWLVAGVNTYTSLQKVAKQFFIVFWLPGLDYFYLDYDFGFTPLHCMRISRPFCLPPDYEHCMTDYIVLGKTLFWGCKFPRSCILHLPFVTSYYNLWGKTCQQTKCTSYIIHNYYHTTEYIILLLY